MRPSTTTTTSQRTTTRPKARTTTPYDDYDYNEIDDESDRTTSGSGKKEVATDGGDREEMNPTTTERTVTINYDGDYESVDDHRRKLNVTNEDQWPKMPDICRGQFDAVSVLRNELFFFKEQVSVNSKALASWELIALN